MPARGAERMRSVAQGWGWGGCRAAGGGGERRRQKSPLWLVSGLGNGGRRAVTCKGKKLLPQLERESVCACVCVLCAVHAVARADNFDNRHN
ncbi:MAG: hypothetical protein KatS3mg100_741 [Candidatus Parcubacteria bacterium]|nr:MAG: hypothetical protein KatS3mg100_741 [Candidatus Parcubacteria bacterium]